MEKWTAVWGQAHAGLSYFSYGSKSRTLRLIISPAISGTSLRIRLSNRYGKDDVLIGGISAAPCDRAGRLSSDGIDLSSAFTIPKGEDFVSEPVPFAVGSGDLFCVSVYVRSGRLTSGNLMNNADLRVMDGDRRHSVFTSHRKRTNDTLRGLAMKLLRFPLHMPIPLFDAVELLNGDGAGSLFVFGDSLSEQGFWVNALEDRVRAELPGRFSVVNKSIMGNRLLRDGSDISILKSIYGTRGIKRLDQDVLAYDNISAVVIELGVNDLLQYSTINGLPNERPTVDELFGGILDVTNRLREKGTKVIVCTLVGFRDFMDSTEEKCLLREKFNSLLREHKNDFDGFLDLAEAVADPSRPGCSRLECLGGDKLHFNALGGKAVADRFDMTVLG